MGISIWQLLIVLVIIILLFGTKKLGSLGNDLGSALRNFKKAVKDGDEAAAPEQPANPANMEKKEANVIEGQATKEKDPH